MLLRHQQRVVVVVVVPQAVGTQAVGLAVMLPLLHHLLLLAVLSVDKQMQQLPRRLMCRHRHRHDSSSSRPAAQRAQWQRPAVVRQAQAAAAATAAAAHCRQQ